MLYAFSSCPHFGGWSLLNLPFFKCFLFIHEINISCALLGARHDIRFWLCSGEPERDTESRHVKVAVQCPCLIPDLCPRAPYKGRSEVQPESIAVPAGLTDGSPGGLTDGSPEQGLGRVLRGPVANAHGESSSSDPTCWAWKVNYVPSSILWQHSTLTAYDCAGSNPAWSYLPSNCGRRRERERLKELIEELFKI